MSASLRLLQLMLLLVAGGTLALVAYALMSAPSMPVERLGLRGYKRTQALRDNSSFAQIEPLMRWLSTRLGGLVSPKLREHLSRQITLAGDVLGLQAEDVVSLSILSTLVSLSFGLAYVYSTDRGPFVAIVAAAVGAFLPYFQLMTSGQNRVRGIQQALPSVVDLMVL